jgi:RimJ/RimL family protein N-acetyltransferase
VAELVAATMGPGGRGEGWWWFYLRCPTQEWAEAMREVLPGERAVEKEREFYVCREVDPRLCPTPSPPARGLGQAWDDGLGSGTFAVVQADEEMLASGKLGGIERIRRQAEGSFGSVEGFLEHGFAFCVVHEGAVVSACSADNGSGGRCEVGIHTDRAYRRRGLGTLAASAAVDWALCNGYEQVGWHCLRQNVASAATARSVGFQKAADYAAFQVCARAADADVVWGNLRLIGGEYAEAAQWYGRALRAVAEEGEGASHLLGKHEDRARYAFQAALARALAGEPASAEEMLAGAIDLSGYRQGGY